MELCWSTPCPPTHSSKRSSASWWYGYPSCGPSVHRLRTTCATCIWVESFPATTCSLRCYTPSEHVCERHTHCASLSYLVLWDETVYVGWKVWIRGENQIKIDRLTLSVYIICVRALFKLEKRKCSLEFGIIKLHLYWRWSENVFISCRATLWWLINWKVFFVLKNSKVISACGHYILDHPQQHIAECSIELPNKHLDSGVYQMLKNVKVPVKMSAHSCSPYCRYKSVTQANAQVTLIVNKDLTWDST